jgi:hypothetical protein
MYELQEMESSEDEVERKLKTMEQAEEEQGEAPAVPMNVEERRGSVVCGGVQMPTELWHQVFAHLDHIALCHTVSLVCWYPSSSPPPHGTISSSEKDLFKI